MSTTRNVIGLANQRVARWRRSARAGPDRESDEDLPIGKKLRLFRLISGLTDLPGFLPVSATLANLRVACPGTPPAAGHFLLFADLHCGESVSFLAGHLASTAGSKPAFPVIAVGVMA
jgi:hypothetical protein